jgi:hypothetical protein
VGIAHDARQFGLEDAVHYVDHFLGIEFRHTYYSFRRRFAVMAAIGQDGAFSAAEAA